MPSEEDLPIVVVHGNPTPEELAAIVVVFSDALRTRRSGRAGSPSTWLMRPGSPRSWRDVTAA